MVKHHHRAVGRSLCPHRTGADGNPVYCSALFTGVRRSRFYPGILLLASIYFPNKVRASVVGIFVLGVPLALTLGSPISGALLEMHGFLGKPGWFWMFFIEGIPAVIMGIFAWFWLDDTPAKARFLNDEEKKALIAQLQQEQRQTETSSVGTALKSLKVWHLALIYGTIQISVYGLMFFLPSQVASLMGSTLGFKESLVAAIPWACSAVGVYYIPRLADKMPARRVLISVICMLAAALGLFVSAWSGHGTRHCRALAVGHRLSLRATYLLDFPGADCVRLGAGRQYRLLHHHGRILQLPRAADSRLRSMPFSATIRRVWSPCRSSPSAARC